MYPESQMMIPHHHRQCHSQANSVENHKYLHVDCAEYCKTDVESRRKDLQVRVEKPVVSWTS